MIIKVNQYLNNCCQTCTLKMIISNILNFNTVTALYSWVLVSCEKQQAGGHGGNLKVQCLEF